MSMTTSQNPVKEFFEENGFYLAKGVFSPPEVSGLEHDFDRIVTQIIESGEAVNARWGGAVMEKIGADTVVLHTHNVQHYSSVWLRALLQDRFLGVAAQILGPDIVLHHTKLFQKPPERGAPFPMHQDWTYFPTEKDSMIAGIIHVSEATDAMGCLRVVPGSHKLGRVEGTSGQAQSELLEEYPLESAVPLEAEPGDVAFFHYFTLHGSMPNTSPKTRKTVLVQLYSGNDRVIEGNAHPDERLTLCGWNRFATRNRANMQK